MDLRLLILLNICFVSSYTVIENYKLKQVVILSRHNLRTPLAENLVEISPKNWPHWKEKSGDLTEKGSILEGYMGSFFSAWLRDQKLLPSGCPDETYVYVYANTKQRTIASAKAFVDKAFPGCHVITHHSKPKHLDPVFNPVIHNTSAIFKKLALEQTKEQLKMLQLNSSYEFLEDILDYKHSNMCMRENKCDLSIDENKINLVPGKKINVTGPLKISNSAVDSFLMEYYAGLYQNDVAWGKLITSQDWRTIMNLNRGYHNVIFNSTLVAHDIAEPLVKYMATLFLNPENSAKVTLLMGHDANLLTVLNAMQFKSYVLPKQYEITPVGGKIVFQKWFDEGKKIYLLRINFVYQSTKGIRNGETLSLSNPPLFRLLELQDCRINDEGFCMWSDFEKILNKF